MVESASVKVLVGVRVVRSKHHSIGKTDLRWHNLPIGLAGLDPVVTMSVIQVQETMEMGVYNLKNHHSQDAHQTMDDTRMLPCRHLDDMGVVVEEAEEASRPVNNSCCYLTSKPHCCNDVRT